MRGGATCGRRRLAAGLLLGGAVAAATGFGAPPAAERGTAASPWPRAPASGSLEPTTAGRGPRTAEAPPGEQPQLCAAGEAVWCQNATWAARCRREAHCAAAPESVAAAPGNRVMGRAAWLGLHSALRREARSLAPDGVAFVGDSITEHLRGTMLGAAPVPGQPAYFHKVWPHGTAVALGIAADETQHLLWRLLDGEAPEEAAAVVLLVGTNNVDMSRHSAEQTAAGVLAAASLLCHLLPSAAVLVQGMLPRGECWGMSKKERKRLRCVPGGTATAKMNTIRAANNILSERAAAACPPRSRYVYCGNHLLRQPQDPESLMDPGKAPDALHPSPAGTAAMWRSCLLPAIAAAAPRSRPAAAAAAGAAP
eukprot:TRINITY_DN8355_c0_g3_i1.p1 TRINITY_DN8355_c0_g3~~TRINITY_DN8355_c0_g3_i1.p1  ORF type:complete len:384 (+),score=86.51 TRINITY_DN8355_c0_g3_i1:54-1154(+)